MGKKSNKEVNYFIWLARGILVLIPLTLIQCYRLNDTSGSPKENLFELVPPARSGISFSNNITENAENFFLKFNYVYDGAGVAVGDVNNDGLFDIYFVGNQVPNKLYLNKGQFEFEDITSTANVSGETDGGWHNGAVMVDINNDGFLDIYVTRGGWQAKGENRENLLFINKGNLTFEERAADFGLDESGFSIHASFFDMDNDGDLDVYITNRPKSFFIPIPQVIQGKRNPDTNARDKLYINQGGTFKEIGLEAGITQNYGFALSVVTADINQDGFSDIFVANDFLENDYLYINQGDGTFKESIREATKHNSFYSMGTDIIDLNNDGLEDIVVSEMLPEDYVRSKTSKASMSRMGYQDILDHGFHHQYMHNVLYINQGQGLFSEVAHLAGISKTDWSWAVLGSDFNNDGYRDLFISNGLKRDVNNLDAEMRGVRMVRQKQGQFTSQEEMLQNLTKDLVELYPINKLSNYVFQNNGDLTFSDKTKTWGMDQESISHGAAVADFNNDGTLDMVVNNMDGDAFLYKNNANKILNNNYLQIKLKGPDGNKAGLGAKIRLEYGNSKQFFELKSVRGYLSSSPAIAHFGLDTVKKIDKVRVAWTDGLENTLKNVTANQLLEISYNNAKPSNKSEKRTNNIVSHKTDQWFPTPYIHQENEYDDYHLQTLLPHSLSQNGPFITTGDVDNDGLEDFYIGGASGFSGQLFIQQEKGTFESKKISAFENDKSFEDMGALLFDANGDQYLDLYVVSGGNEFSQKSDMYQDRLYINNGDGDFVRSNKLPNITASGSCVVASDFDNDGDNDLFVGGRLVPNAYPFPAKSYLLRNNEGNFVDVTKTMAPDFAKLGMVTSAVWSDVDQQEDKELIVAGEWMPIRVYKITGDRFVDISSSFNLDKTEGWWNYITTTDIDEDGDQDLIAGNLGLNSEFKASDKKPFHIFSDDFDRNGTFDVLLAKHHNNDLVPVQNKNRLEKQIPNLTSKFSSHQEFANSTVKHIIGPALDDALHYTAHMFESQIFINTESGFQTQRLPIEAQVSTINGIVVLDYNKDGIRDLLLGGNNFNVEYGTTRSDASVGLILKGTKRGEFQPIKPFNSGFYIPWNVKSINPINLGYDNQTQGILVGSNQDTLRLFTVKKDKETSIQTSTVSN